MSAAALSIISGTNSAVGIYVQDGHIKGSGTQVVLNTITSTFIPLASVAYSGTYNDIKGRVSVNFTGSPSIAQGQYIDINVQYIKPYSASSNQSVIVTPVLLNLNAYIISNTNTSFTVRFINNTTTTFSLVTNFEFNYFVIE